MQLEGRGDQHVAARKDTLADDQQINIDKNRFVDMVDGHMGHEVKSGEGKLSPHEVEQMMDYGRMVAGEAQLNTKNGITTLKHVRYSFTSPAGARANVDIMLEALENPELKTRISFELFTPDGKVTPPITSVAELKAQTWLFQ